jgi:hypothetical protein
VDTGEHQQERHTGSAIESNYGPGRYGGWADLSASPWLYNLFKEDRTTDGHLDPRLYWTIGTYEADWESNPQTLGNVPTRDHDTHRHRGDQQQLWRSAHRQVDQHAYRFSTAAS